MAFIHVIIPCYNAEKYLEQAVYSVLNQPLQDVDITIVDDGSTDCSAQLCDVIADREPRVHVIHKTNGGVSAARNVGIDYILSAKNNGCNNDFIAFLDADDYWIPEVITPQLGSQIKAEAETDIFVFGNCLSDNAMDHFSHPIRYDDKVVEGGDGCIWKVLGSFCANFYRVRLFQHWGIRFAEGLKYSEDKIFALQSIFLAKYVHFFPQILHIYRENGVSAMKRVYAIDPIDYYMPIIDGWIGSDRFLNSYSEETGRNSKAGSTLAAIYFMDMAQEHYERWHRPSRLYAAYKSHPDSYLMEQMDSKAVSAKQYANCTLLLQHPVRYKLKYNAIGVVKYLMRMALRLKIVQKLRHLKKYPLAEMPR